jgi:ElaB/YqjD/DUF883 family membrane-anchored ribosome-binding protein
MAESDVQKELKALREDFVTLKTDLADLAEVLRDKGVGRAEGLRTSIEDELKDSRESLRRKLSAAKTSGRKRLDELEEEVGDHPFGALALAFGIGFILGKILDLGTRR